MVYIDYAPWSSDSYKRRSIEIMQSKPGPNPFCTIISADELILSEDTIKCLSAKDSNGFIQLEKEESDEGWRLGAMRWRSKHRTWRGRGNGDGGDGEVRLTTYRPAPIEPTKRRPYTC